MKTNRPTLSLSIVRIILLAGIISCFCFSLHADTCDPAPNGLVSLWPGEGNAQDLTGADNGTLRGPSSYVAGKVNQAFNFNGLSNFVALSDVAALHLQNLTIEGWIRRSDPVHASLTNADGALLFSFGTGGYGLGLTDDGQLFLSNIGNDAVFSTAVLVDTNSFHHVAVTKSNSTVTFYIDGILAGSEIYDTLFNFSTTPGIGADGRGEGDYFGAIDELSVYNRPLSSNEVSAIYVAGTAGKCFLSGPVITAQPVGHGAAIGDTVTFSVTATGTAPLYYQWFMNNSQLPGATGAALVLNNVQSSNAGTYFVQVSNVVAGVTSSNAILTIVASNSVTCLPLAAKALGWWRAESNTFDEVTLQPATSAQVNYVLGESGLAFTFNGTNDYVALSNSPAYQLQNFSIEAWVKRSSSTIASMEVTLGGQFFSYGAGGYGFGVFDDGRLFLSAINYSIVFSTALFTDVNAFHHVAVTKSNETVIFYLDGQAAGTNDYDPGFVFNTPPAIGARGDGTGNFLGAIDELAIYSNILSAGDILSIYTNGPLGKCSSLTAPVIVVQPVSHTNIVGDTVGLSVGTYGTAPLSYQWSWNGTNISGSTNPALTLANLQFTNAGSYSVLVTNLYGNAQSIDAVVVVLPVPLCAPANSNLVAWWRAENNASDEVGPGDGTINDVTYTAGKVGNAFNFNGTDGVITISNNVPLQLQTLSIEAWIKRGNASQASLVSSTGGSFLSYDLGGYQFGLLDNGKLFLTRVTNAPNTATYATSISSITDTGNFHHVAVTKAGSVINFYIDGTFAGSASDSATYSFSTVLSIGGTLSGINNFYGAIDELSVYASVLTSAQIQSNYNASISGTCPGIAPSIITQPANVSGVVGNNYSFSAVAVGSKPLSYQWNFNGAPLPGATSSILALPGVALTNAGTYSVLVTNLYGSVNSGNAILTVVSPACAPISTNLVGWWPAESNAWDVISNNDGTLSGNVGYTNGKVGLAFNFFSNDGSIALPNSPLLQLQNFTIEAWIKRASPIQSSLLSSNGSIFSYGPGGYGFSLGNDGGLYLTQVASGDIVGSSLKLADTNYFHHVVVTKSATLIAFYLDGAPAGTNTTAASYTFSTSPMIGSSGSAGNYFYGAIDEVGCYSNALSAGQVLNLYNAGSIGKCPNLITPFMTVQPLGGTTHFNQSFIFSALAGGSRPLSYQWVFNGASIPGATATDLYLMNLQSTNAGTYNVVVTNLYGAVTSSPSVLVLTSNLNCQTPSTNIVGWWSGDGNTLDQIGGNNGVLSGSASYINGKDSLAFNFYGTNGAVTLANATALQLQTFTIEAWVKRASSSQSSILSRNGGSLFSYGFNGYGFGLQDNGSLYLSKIGFDVQTSTAKLTDTNSFHHVAVTKSGTSVAFYLDGVLAGTATTGSTYAFSSAPVIGGTSIGINYFYGAIDEVSCYSSALSGAQIQAISTAGADGKCQSLSAPAIVTQPGNASVFVNQSVTISVSATGTFPLSYQWSFNGTNINGATASSIGFASVQLTNAGTYAVVITNLYGSVSSSNAILQVSTNLNCQPALGSLVGWWPGNGNALDVISNNNGVMSGTANYTNGEVSLAFNFYGNNGAVTLSNSTALQLQTFTVEAWVKRASSSQASILSRDGGCILSYGYDGYGIGLVDSGAIFISKIGTDIYVSTAKITDTTSFHHIAVTKSGSSVIFYLDGVVAGTSTVASTYAFTSPPVIGGNSLGQNYFYGAIDEVSVYSAALTATQVQNIMTAGNGGKCVPPVVPAISTQPLGAVLYVNQSNTFTVVATGVQPLTYQWAFDGTNIAGATDPSLILPSVQLTNAGSYSVVVSNAYGSITSSDAILQVSSNLNCQPILSSLAGWWPGNGNTLDAISNNNGVMSGSAGYTNGEVSLAFNFYGTNGAVTLSNSTALQLQTFTIEAWVKRASSSQASILSRDGGGVLSYGLNGYGFGLVDNGAIFLSKIGIDIFKSTTKITDTTSFHHIAVTKSGTSVTFYLDGVVAGTATVSSTYSFTSVPVIGGNSLGLNYFYGAIDEVSVYSSALTATQVQNIMTAGVNGKCPPLNAPGIATQPVGAVLYVNQSNTLTVVATGTQPLVYQWVFDGTNIAGATDPSLFLPSVQFTNAGSYSVVITNLYGSVTSSSAFLAVNPPPLCVAPTNSIVGWWPGNSNSIDVVSGNNGALSGTVNYVSGEVSNAFNFYGTNGAVTLSNTPVLQLQNLTLEAWVKRSSSSQSSILSRSGGAVFSYGFDGYGFGLLDDGTLYISKIGNDIQTSAAKLTDTNSFHHIAVTKSGSSVTFYLDGVMAGTATAGLTYIFTSAPAIGGSSVGNYFYGAIDEVSCYSGALTADQIQAIYAASFIGKCPGPISPKILTQPLSQTVLRGTNVSFGVFASGTPLLTYQWNLNGAPLATATHSTLSLTNVQVVQSGSYTVIVSNAVGGATSSVAVLTVTNPLAVVQIISTNGLGGSLITVPVKITANGNEGSVSFSVNFPASALAYNSLTLSAGAGGATAFVNTNAIGSGLLGVGLFLSSGTLPAGTNELLQIQFTAKLLPTATNAPIVFTNTPTPIQVADSLGQTLPAVFTNGTVSIALTDFEGDVSPRPTGDRTSAIADWILAGRYAAQLDAPTNASEIQRADCAPRGTLGDGAITVIDWVQAGRYWAGYDSQTPVGGPTTLSTPPTAINAIGAARQVIATSSTVAPGQICTVAISMSAQGNENAMGFSLAFDPTKFAYVSSSLGAGVSGATFLVNTNLLASGNVGYALSFAPGNAFTTANLNIVNVTLKVLNTTGSFPVTFTDAPILRQVSSATAVALNDTGYANGTIAVSLPKLSLAPTNNSVLLSWPLMPSNFMLQVTGTNFSPWTNISGLAGTNSGSNLLLWPISGPMSIFRLQSQ